MTENIRTYEQTMEQIYLDCNLSGDVKFLVESQEISAHRMILAAISPRYEAEFQDPNVVKISVPNVSAAAFNVFLKFFYKETVDLTMDNIEAVLDLAQQSLVDEFVETCVNFLKGAIRANNNLCMANRLANLCGSESLRLDCQRRISTNTMVVFGSDDFLRCDRDTLLQILKMDSLNCTEKDVFTACIAWARAQCKQNHLNDGKPENLRTVLGDAIHQIRFSSFNAEEFTDLHKSMEGLFKPEESIELFYITNKAKDYKPKKFNQTARTPQNGPDVTLDTFDEENIFWSMGVDRFLRIKDRSFESVEIGRVALQCSRPIRLYGIALGVRFNTTDLDNLPETVSVQTGDGSVDTTTESKYKIFQSPTKHDETIIVFERPIEKITSFSCDFQLPFKQLNHELVVQPSVRGQGITFTFDSKWVTRVFCEEHRNYRPPLHYLVHVLDWNWIVMDDDY